MIFSASSLSRSEGGAVAQLPDGVKHARTLGISVSPTFFRFGHARRVGNEILVGSKIFSSLDTAQAFHNV